MDIRMDIIGRGAPWHLLGIRYRGVQWEGGAVDWGSVM